MTPLRRGRHSTLLRDSGSGLLRGLLPSTGLHLLLLGALTLPGLLGIALPGCSHRPSPLIDKDIFMVEAVVLPKARSMPKKAAAPKPQEAGEQGQKVEPPILEDQMVLKKKQEQKKEGVKKKPAKKPEEKVEKKKSREDLLAARTEEEADEPIFETSPDGSDDAKKDQALKARFGRPMNAYERLVHDRIKDNWFPKFTQQTPDPKTWAVVSFEIDASGNITSPAMERRSGDRVYDSSCLRAVSRTRKVPPPPSGASRSFHIRFSPEDKK